MSQPQNKWLQIWLDEIRSPHPNVVRTSDAARQLAGELRHDPALRQWLEALGSDTVDRIDCDSCQAELPDFIHAQTSLALQAEPPATRFDDVRAHLALCPYCLAAYAQVSEWVLASQADEIPVAATYPAFDLAFLDIEAPATSVTWPATMLQRSLEEGRRWLADAAGGLYILFGDTLPSKPASGWAIKSAEGSTLLAQTILSEDEIGDWEIEVSAFADEHDETNGRVEVAIYPLGSPLGNGAGIRVTLGYDAITATQTTDIGGVAFFANVPLEHLPHVVVRVELPERPNA